MTRNNTEYNQYAVFTAYKLGEKVFNKLSPLDGSV